MSAMILCVSDVIKSDNSTAFELTDGWHRIYAAPDRALEAMANSGKIFIGRKLRISLAQVQSNSKY